MTSSMERVRQLEHELEEVRGKLHELKYDKKLAAVFFEELWRSEERERCATLAHNYAVRCKATQDADVADEIGAQKELANYEKQNGRQRDDEG